MPARERLNTEGDRGFGDEADIYTIPERYRGEHPELYSPPTEKEKEAARWKHYDTALELAYLLGHGADWAQTLHIARNPEKYTETNVFLGDHPSTGRVNSYMTLATLLQGVAAKKLPTPLREAMQLLLIGDTWKGVDQNRKIGIGLHY